MTLRVADLEVLFTADTKDVAAAQKQVQQTGKNIESKPITQKVDANVSPFEAAMTRAEQASAGMSSKLVRNFLDSDRAAKMSADEIQRVLVKSYGVAETAAADLAKVMTEPITVQADEKPALASMDRVEEAAKRLVSHKTAVTIDANIERAEKSLQRVRERLDYLHSVEGELDVSADIKRAEANLQKVERQRDALVRSRATIEVDADTVPAEDALNDVANDAANAGKEGGDGAGKNLVGGILGALAAIPVAGVVIGVGQAIGDALLEGAQTALGKEAGRDRLAALTGLDEAAAIRVANAAGEAYANNFGESIESNMDTARLSLQFDIIDEQATTRDAQKVIEGLAGIADVLGEDVGRVAQSVATLLSTGVARSAQHAFDILAAGARNGVNRSEDLLDTFTEYPALFARLGLSGEEAMGLINQGLEGGARNSDLAADALKEFQIRATDASELSAQSFEALGLNAEEMTAKIAGGGEGAREGLDQVLDGLRAMEDPVARNAAAVGLFGTQAEDLGAALFNMDLSTAVEQLGQVTGAAQTMFDTLASNDASKLETAKRNIETAMSGIQAALASALSEPLGEAADWVTRNRGPLLQFFQDLVNGAFDFAIGATEAFNEFVSGPLAAMVEGLAGLIDFINGPFEGRPKEIDDMAKAMRGFDDNTDGAVERLEDMRDQFNGFADGQVALGKLNDAAYRTAEAVSQVGQSADGATVSNEQLTQQVADAVKAYEDEIRAAQDAGESQENLTSRYDTTREALKQQLVQMGYTEEGAQDLIDTMLLTPDKVETTFASNSRSVRGDVEGLSGTIGRVPRSGSTSFSSNARGERGNVEGLTRAIGNTPGSKKTTFSSNAGAVGGSVDGLKRRIQQLPNKTVSVGANTGPADSAMRQFNSRWSSHTVSIYGRQMGPTPVKYNAAGGILEFMADGGLTPMQSLAQMVPADTWRVVGDRPDVSELYAPLDGSARSWDLILEGIRRMPGRPPGGSGDAVRGGLSIGTLVLGSGGPRELFAELQFQQGM